MNRRLSVIPVLGVLFTEKSFAGQLKTGYNLSQESGHSFPQFEIDCSSI